MHVHIPHAVLAGHTQIFHALFLAFIALYTFTMGVLAMVLHEVGHIAAAFAIGVKVKKVGAQWKGMYTVREQGNDFQNLIVTISGPALNLMLMLVFWNISKTFCLANFMMFAFNILPLAGSDGDRAWGCWRRLRAPKLKQAEVAGD